MCLDFARDKDGNIQEDNDNYHSARVRAMPKEFFLCPPANVLNVSKNLGIGYGETLLLRHFLGKDLFGNKLKSFGMNPFSPLEPDFTCPGVPAAPGIAAQPCMHYCDDDDDEEQEEEELYISMVGAEQPDHVYFGNFCCQKCHRKYERLELVTLKEMKKKGTINPTQEERLHKLEGSDQNKRDCTNALRKRKVEEEGLEAVQVHERTKYQKHAEKIKNDPVAAEKKLAKRRESYRKRKAEGKIKPSNSKQLGLSNKNVRYPAFFQQKMVDGGRVFLALKGSQFVSIADVNKLFNALLKREKDYIKAKKGTPEAKSRLGSPKIMTDVPVDKDGDPKYYKVAYAAAITEIPLKKSNISKLSYEWLDYNEEEHKPNGLKVPQIIEQVLQQV